MTVGAPGAGNVISGNGVPGSSGSGIQALAVTTAAAPTTVLTDTSGLVVQGNRIGTNAAGTAAVPNNVGVNINAGSAQVGGTSAGQGNVIAGNGGIGLNLAFQTVGGGSQVVVTQSSNVTVQGNVDRPRQHWHDCAS